MAVTFVLDFSDGQRLETSGNGRLLSTPRVSTQNNVEAEMTQGVQIPIQTVANNTVTVTFKDAALTLKVTPQITAANTVIMAISVENSQADFSRAVNGIPPINADEKRYCGFYYSVLEYEDVRPGRWSFPDGSDK